MSKHAATTAKIRRSPLAALSLVAAAALALSACAPEDTTEDAGQAEEVDQQETAEETGDDQTADDSTDDAGADDETTEDTGNGDDAATNGDETTDDAATEEGTTDAAAGGDHPVHQAIEAALAEYEDGVITEFEDNTNDDGYVEVYVYDGETEWELEVDSESFEIIDTEDDGIDGDDREEAEAVSIEISEALQTAESESDGEPEEGELDTEDGTVVWEFEMTNDVEVYVDVSSGEVVSVDD